MRASRCILGMKIGSLVPGPRSLLPIREYNGRNPKGRAVKDLSQVRIILTEIPDVLFASLGPILARGNLKLERVPQASRALERLIAEPYDAVVTSHPLITTTMREFLLGIRRPPSAWTTWPNSTLAASRLSPASGSTPRSTGSRLSASARVFRLIGGTAGRSVLGTFTAPAYAASSSRTARTEAAARAISSGSAMPAARTRPASRVAARVYVTAMALFVPPPVGGRSPGQ